MERFIPAQWRVNLATCILGIVLFIPTPSWAVTFTIDASIVCGFCTGTFNFDGQPGMLTFSANQTIQTDDPVPVDTNLPYTTTMGAGQNFTIFQLDVPATVALCGAVCTANRRLDVRIGFQNAMGSVIFDFVDENIDFFNNGVFQGSGMGRISNDRLGQVMPFSPGPTIPEPTTIALFATGLLGLAGYRWRQGRSKEIQVG